MNLYDSVNRKNGRVYKYRGLKPKRPKRPAPLKEWADFSRVAGISEAAARFKVSEYDVIRARKIHG